MTDMALLHPVVFKNQQAYLVTHASPYKGKCVVVTATPNGLASYTFDDIPEDHDGIQNETLTDLLSCILNNWEMVEPSPGKLELWSQIRMLNAI